MLELELDGVWSSRPIADGIAYEAFTGDTQIVLRAWLAAGMDRGRLGDRILNTLERTPTQWELRSEGPLADWPARVVAGHNADGWTLVHVLAELPHAMVSLARYDEGELDLPTAARQALQDLARLDTSVLDRRARAASSLDSQAVRPSRLVPWVLDDPGRASVLTRGAVDLGNGLSAVPAEAVGASIRLFAPDHPIWDSHPPEVAMTRAIVQLAGQLGRTVPLERWVLPNGAVYVVVGPHPAAHGAVLVPDLGAQARAQFGELEPTVLFCDRDRLLIVPTDWPEDWKASALGRGRRRADDLPLPGPIWRPQASG